LPAQTATAPVEFEVASVKPSESFTAAQVTAALRIAGSQITCTGMSLRDYLKLAFDVKDAQIEGPDWMATQRFDIAAKIPLGAKPDQLRGMMKSLLESRFHLAVHRAPKDLPVYALTLGKTPLKLKDSPLDAETDLDSAGRAGVNVNVQGGRGGTQVSFGRGSSVAILSRRVELKKMSMTIFVTVLARFVDLPVLDQTGLKATYDFSLDFNENDLGTLVRSAVAEGSAPPEALRAFDHIKPDPAPSIFDSLEKLGLKLEKQKAPLDVLFIDRLDRTPTEN
jgi:uncharacterized protein (TIGR03435 family)